MEEIMNTKDLSVQEFAKLTPEQQDQYKLIKFEEAVVSPNFRYAKAKSWRADGYVANDNDYTVYAYGITDEMPFIHNLASVWGNFQGAIAILDKHNKPFPLSPTEKY
jgi:hypothetical protein